MPNWKNRTEYEFDDRLDRARWAWEFMRRNSEYRADYAESKAAWKAIPRDGHSHIYRGESAERALAADELSRKLGAKWGQRGPIWDPSSDQVPPWFGAFPIEPDADEVDSYYRESEPGGLLEQVPEFVTLTFDARMPIPPQLERAGAIIEARQLQVGTESTVNKGLYIWPTYLRLLDALEAGASTPDIINGIETYLELKDTGKDGARYPANDRISDHKKSALGLRANPLALLR
jgi:hypothetical protein